MRRSFRVESSTVDFIRANGAGLPTAVAFQGGNQATARRVRAILAQDGIAEASSSPAVVVVDVAASDALPEALFTEIWERLPDVPIVAVVTERKRRQAKDALRAGAAGIVYETRLEETLPLAVHSAAAGQVSMPAELGPRSSRQPLSSREKQVLGMVVMGFTNCEIANKLFLAESTIKSHLSSAFGKLGVHSRSEAAALILDPAEGLGMGILTIPTD